MKTLRFKTNIKCGGCIAAVTPHLDKLEGLESWNVDLESGDRVLTVRSEADEKSVEEALQAAGYAGTALD